MRQHTTGPETSRLRHRALGRDDAEAFFTLNTHPEVMRHTGEPMPASVEEVREAIETYPDFAAVGFGRWGSVLKETGRLIGFCGLKHLAEIDAVDIGFRFMPEYWGRGLATEASTACVRYGFDEIGLDRIVGIVLPANAASIRVLEKTGLRPAGGIDYDGYDALLYEIRRGDRCPAVAHASGS